VWREREIRRGGKRRRGSTCLTVDKQYFFSKNLPDGQGVIDFVGIDTNAGSNSVISKNPHVAQTTKKGR
jgi:hypothetical protein